MAFKNTLLRALKISKKNFYVSVALVAIFTLAACPNRSIPSAKRIDIASQFSPSGVIQIDGSINPNDVLHVERSNESNHEGQSLTPEGAVSSQGDRIIQVMNYAQPEHSTVTLLESNGRQLAQRELQWLVGPVKFTANGQYIITSGSDRTTRIWNLQLNQIASFEGHQTQVQNLQVSPDGHHFLTTEYPDTLSGPPPLNFHVSTVRLFDLQATQIALFEGFPIGAYQSVKFSPNSQQLLMLKDGVVQLTDLQGTPQITFNQNQQKFDIAQLSSDGRFVLAADQNTMRLWDIQGTLKAEFRNWTLTPDERITSIQIGNEGRWIATGSSTGLLRLWTAQNNQVITVQAHQGEIHAIAVNPDSTQVVTLGEKNANAVGDNDIRLWNLQGQLLEVIEGDRLESSSGGTFDRLSASFSVQFTPDGKHIIATDMGQIGTTIQWEL